MKFLIARQYIHECYIDFYENDNYKHMPKLVLDWEFFVDGLCLYSGAYGFQAYYKMKVSEAVNQQNFSVFMNEIMRTHINNESLEGWSEIKKMRNIFRNSLEYREIQLIIKRRS